MPGILHRAAVQSLPLWRLGGRKSAQQHSGIASACDLFTLCKYTAQDSVSYQHETRKWVTPATALCNTLSHVVWPPKWSDSIEGTPARTRDVQTSLMADLPAPDCFCDHRDHIIETLPARIDNATAENRPICFRKSYYSGTS